MGTAARADYKSPDEVAEGRSAHPGKEHRGGSKETNRRRNVTPETKERIRELYEKTGNGHEVARLLGLGSTTVYNHLGLGRPGTPIWTDDEIQVMVDGYLGKRPVKAIAAKLKTRSPRAVMIRMCRYRKQVRDDPKKRRALNAITLALKAIRKADIFREVES